MITAALQNAIIYFRIFDCHPFFQRFVQFIQLQSLSPTHSLSLSLSLSQQSLLYYTQFSLTLFVLPSFIHDYIVRQNETWGFTKGIYLTVNGIVPYIVTLSCLRILENNYHIATNIILFVHRPELIIEKCKIKLNT